MRTILLSAFFLYSLCLDAQNAKENSPKKVKNISIKLSKFPIADFPENSLPVSDIRIAQMVRDSVIVGHAVRSTALIYFKITKPLTDFLQQHIYRMYKGDFAKEGIKMFWVLKDLKVGEKTGSSSYVRINIDGYVSTDGNLFKKACELDTVYVRENVFLGDDEEIESAFKVFSKRVLLYAKDALAGNGEQKTVEQIISQPYQNINVPILAETIYNEGIYKNFQEFLQNKPSVQDYDTIVVAKKKIKFFTKSINGAADTISVWGICKAGKIYKYHADSLVAIEKQGTGFIVSDFIKNNIRRNRDSKKYNLAGSIAGAVIGGMPGMIIGGAAMEIVARANKYNLILVQSIPYIDKPGMQPFASCIDMRTGNFSF
jgi:hypothetical protein